MSAYCQPNEGAPTNVISLHLAHGSNQENRQIHQTSLSTDRQEVHVSDIERPPQVLDHTEQIPEHPRYQSDLHPSYTPPVQGLLDNRGSAGEDEMNESIPLRISQETDQGMRQPRSQKNDNSQSEEDIEARRVRELSLLRIWWFEIGACVLILLMFAAIVGTLCPYQGQPKPNWPYDLSTNTIIAFYVVIMKISLVSVLSAGLGQLKWSWFHEERPLYNLGQYDEAARGPWGALTILWTTAKAKALLPTIGALIMILATILEPMGQQVLHFYPCFFQKHDSIATIPTSNWASVGLGYHLHVFTSSLRMGSQSAINAGIFDPIPKDVSPYCPSGNCTFSDNYASAGWCSTCTDISDLVYNTTENVNYTIPSSNTSEMIPTFRYRLSSSNLSVTPRDAETFVLRQPDSWLTFEALMGLTVAQNNTDWTRRGYGAAQCRLYPCVRRHLANVSFGVFSESVIAPPVELVFPDSPDESGEYSRYASLIDVYCLNPSERAFLERSGYELSENKAWLNYTLSVKAKDGYENGTATSIRPECIYQTSIISTSSLGSFLDNLMSGTVQASLGISGTSSVVETIFNEFNINFDSINNVFSRIAQSLTVWSRQDNETSIGKVAPGRVYSTETCVSAQWLWLIYHAVVVLGTFVFLCWTMIHTRRNEGSRQDYKTALLPLMFVGLDGSEVERQQRSSFESLAGVEKRAQGMKVRLEKTEAGWNFVVVGRAPASS